MTSVEHGYVLVLVKEIATFGGDVSAMVPARPPLGPVMRALAARRLTRPAASVRGEAVRPAFLTRPAWPRLLDLVAVLNALGVP